jgi:ribosome-binding factor A
MLLRDFNDPRLSGVVVSRVTVTADLSEVSVFFVVINDDTSFAKAKIALTALRKVAGAVRTGMATKLGLRRAPTFEFAIDRGREESDRLDALLAEVSLETKGASKT